jgi:hypothetical protein
MTISTITDTTRSRRCIVTHAVYDTAHDAAVADFVSTTLALGQVGPPAAANYTIHRMYVEWDTSIIPAGSIVTAAKIKLFLALDLTDNDFDITVLNGQPLNPADPPVVADYDYLLYAGNGGTLNTSLLGAGYNNIVLNATGMGWINTGGITKLCIRSSNDIADTPEGGTGSSWIIWGSTGDFGMEPKLEVTWAYPPRVGSGHVSYGLFH